jgi:hypothetical protein
MSSPTQASGDLARTSLNWLQMIDAEKYDDSWSHSSSLLRLQSTPDQWQRRMTRVRDAYGALSLRSFTGVSFSKSLAGFPDGSFATVRYQSSFFKQRNAAESVSLRYEDGVWRPVAYSLR